MIKNLIRMYRIINKIRKNLPVCTKEGNSLQWNIWFDTPKEYDPNTGKVIKTGTTTVKIEQAPPRCLRDRRVYMCDRHGNLKKTSLIWSL